MFKKLFCFLFLAFLLSEIDGHTYHLGSCPGIEPMNDFNINGMLGIWYVIQKTSTASTCITYNITKLDEPYHYNLEQVSQHFILGLTPLKHEYRYTGELSTPDPSVPGKMKVKFPLNVVGKASFTVFMTDYDNYAGIYTCQGLGIGHRESASILSRTRTLNKVYLDKLRTRLSSYNIDPFDLSIISQTGCPRNKNGSEGVNINIDDETFSPHSIAGVVRTAGEKIGDGVEFLAGGAKRIYNSVTNEESTSESGSKIENAAEYIYGSNNRSNTNGQRSRPDRLQDGRSASGQIVNADARLTENQDAEWLP